MLGIIEEEHVIKNNPVMIHYEKHSGQLNNKSNIARNSHEMIHINFSIYTRQLILTFMATLLSKYQVKFSKLNSDFSNYFFCFLS